MSALTIGHSPRRLEADVAMPAVPPRAAAVLCHPHPQYGGDMENGVVVAVGRALVAAGIVALRFNFGGVGRSEGGWSGGADEVRDAQAACDALASRLVAGLPLVLVGYSFGAWVALEAAADGCPARAVVAIAPPLDLLPCRFPAVPVDAVMAAHDQYCDPARLPAVVRVRTIRGADHFFAGREAEVAAAVVDCFATVPG